MNVIHRVCFAKVLQCYHNACFTFFTYFYASFFIITLLLKYRGGSELWRESNICLSQYLARSSHSTLVFGQHRPRCPRPPTEHYQETGGEASFEDLFYHQFVCCNAGGDANEKQYDGDYEHHLHCFPVFPGIILLSEILFMVKILHKRYLDLS